MKKQKFEMIKIKGIGISVDISALVKSETLYFNATEMARQFGKDLQSFMRMKDTREYISILEADPSALKTVAIRTTQRGRNPGTWMHQKMALRFARWLSVEVEYPDMTEAIMNARDDPRSHHFSNENDMLYMILFVMTTKEYCEHYEVKEVRDALSEIGWARLKKAQRLNMSMIETGMSYPDRKAKLAKMFKVT